MSLSCTLACHVTEYLTSSAAVPLPWMSWCSSDYKLFCPAKATPNAAYAPGVHHMSPVMAGRLWLQVAEGLRVQQPGAWSHFLLKLEQPTAMGQKQQCLDLLVSCQDHEMASWLSAVYSPWQISFRRHAVIGTRL
jgi:hypothetical protein